MTRKKTYRPPATDAGRIAEAKAAIGRLESTLNTGSNRFGEYGRNVRDSIARWQSTIDQLTNKGK